VATRENVRNPPAARAAPPPEARVTTVTDLESVMSVIVIVMVLIDRNEETVFAQVYRFVDGASGNGNETVIGGDPSQVSTIVVGEGNDTLGAVGKPPAQTTHVKVGVYESAWALGAPMATNSTVMMIHNDFRISSDPQTRTLTHELQCNYESKTRTF
jgi:hypothetical protein